MSDSAMSISARDAEVASALVANVRRSIDARLDAVCAETIARAESAGAAAASVARVGADLARRGGKRLRPALTFAAAIAVAGEEGARALAPALIDAGAAWELLQAYLLIHDDWMDQDIVRRGGPTAHVTLARGHENGHLGASLAVLAGDLLSAVALRVLAAMPASAAVTREACALFGRVHEEVVLGQTLDVALASPDAATVERMHRLKTASYTTEGPIALGAIVAQATAAQRDALAAFATPIGIAFQLRDDVLGSFGDEAETGKAASGDLRTGKRTTLVLDALATLPSDDARRFERLLGHCDDAAEIGWARAAIARSGARDRVEARIAALESEGLAHLGGAFAEPAALRGLARALTKRSA